jgi:hypothetical protein
LRRRSFAPPLLKNVDAEGVGAGGSGSGSGGVAPEVP